MIGEGGVCGCEYGVCGCEGGLLLVSMECVVGRVECDW